MQSTEKLRDEKLSVSSLVTLVRISVSFSFNFSRISIVNDGLRMHQLISMPLGMHLVQDWLCKPTSIYIYTYKNVYSEVQNESSKKTFFDFTENVMNFENPKTKRIIFSFARNWLHWKWLICSILDAIDIKLSLPFILNMTLWS